MAHSIDFREKAVAYKDSGRTFKELKEAFGIDNKTYKAWVTLYTETGSYAKREVTRKPKKIDTEKLREAVREKPDAYLKELAEPFGCSQQAVFYALEKMKISRKKNFHLQ
jgi:transposase